MSLSMPVMPLPDDVLKERLEMRDRGADCLSDRTLSDLAAATLPHDEFRRAQTHLGTCLTCLQAYASLRRLLEINDSRALRARLWLASMPRLFLSMLPRPSRAGRPLVGWAAAAVTMALLVVVWMIAPGGRASAPAPHIGSAPPPTNREVEQRPALKQEEQAAADTARAQMVAAKQRAAPQSPGFAQAVQSEKQAIALYAQESFTEATASFRSATELFAKARPAESTPVSTTPPAPVAAVAQAPSAQQSVEIRAALDTYVRAVETKDLELLQQVRPGLTADEIRRVRQSNEIKQSHKIDLRVSDITVTGETAQAHGWREDVVVLRSGQRLQSETKFSYTLKQSARGWVIDQVRESAEGATTRPREAKPPAPEPRN